MKTWIIRIIVGVLAIALIGVLGVSAWLVERFSASKPRTTGEVSLAVIERPAQVVRDENGIVLVDCAFCSKQFGIEV